MRSVIISIIFLLLTSVKTAAQELDEVSLQVDNLISSLSPPLKGGGREGAINYIIRHIPLLSAFAQCHIAERRELERGYVLHRLQLLLPLLHRIRIELLIRTYIASLRQTLPQKCQHPTKFL